jgi:hypothetical protein
MSKLQFETELKQLQGKLASLYGEMQQLFLRHGDVAPQAGPKIMPHLEMAKKAVEGLTQPVSHPAKLSDPGD